MIFLDTETCGLHGMAVLIQYAIDDGDIILYSPWSEQVGDTLELIESFANHPGGIVGFNLAFDWFQLVKMYNTFLLLAQKKGYTVYPEDHINFIANECEAQSRLGVCVKPVTAMDLMLHARKGPYQSTMDRKNIGVRRVPTTIARMLADELEKRVKLKDVYFARRKNKSLPKWSIDDIKRADGDIDPDFKNITLRFAPSSALKALAIDALNLPPDITLFHDIEIDTKLRPVEVGWAPFATATSCEENGWRCQLKKGNKRKKGWAWPGVIQQHINHWKYNTLAREYALKDVVYTRDLYRFFGSPPLGDDDSILACMVGAVRWRGFCVDLEMIRTLRTQALIRAAKAPKAPKRVFKYITDVMSDVEKAVLVSAHSGSTAKIVLEELSAMKDSEGNLLPQALRAKECLDARKADKEIDVFDKLLQAGRFHASFKIIGTKSSRMSGADGLNAQGIDHRKQTRLCFPLADDGLELCGGDFSGFEVTIADAVYDDDNLHNQLLTCYVCKNVHPITHYYSGVPACPFCGSYSTKCCKKEQIGVWGKDSKCVVCGELLESKSLEDTRRKIHGLFGQELKGGASYEEIIASKGTQDDWYDKGKRGVFGKMYGGNWNTLVTKLGIDEEVAKKADEGFEKRYPGIGKSREKISDMFSALRQPGGIGSKVEWHEPADYIETINGFRRYFTLEFQICKVLHTLAEKIPPAWKQMKMKCRRRDRDQFVFGAAMSALFAAAFNIQSQVMRAAGNHVIQSTGAIETKRLQRRIWDLQDNGMGKWKVVPMNVHDEIMTPSLPNYKPKIKDTVDTVINEIRKYVPLVKMDWNSEMKSWAEK